MKKIIKAEWHLLNYVFLTFNIDFVEFYISICFIGYTAAAKAGVVFALIATGLLLIVSLLLLTKVVKDQPVPKIDPNIDFIYNKQSGA